MSPSIFVPVASLDRFMSLFAGIVFLYGVREKNRYDIIRMRSHLTI